MSDDIAKDEDSTKNEFGAGTRVRLIEGELAGIEGEIFWWGRAKWGTGMRAGVKAGNGDKHWAAAEEIRAIDSEGNELDPQPAVRIPIVVIPKVRHCEFTFGVARLITATRLKRGWPVGKSAEAVVRLERLRRIEEELDCRIPDPILAYVASGLGVISEPAGILRLTADLRDRFDGSGEAADPHPLAGIFAFHNDNGDYLTFSKGDPPESFTYELLLHEESYAPAAAAASDLEAFLEAQVGDADELDRKVHPFRVMWDFRPEEEEDEEPAVVWVSHKKFGRGEVLASEPTSKGDKLTIRFENEEEERKLLGRFVTFE